MLQYGAIATMNDLKSRLIDSSRNALAQRRFEDAHRNAMQVLQTQGPEAEAFFVLALIAVEHGNAGKAAEILDRAIALAPGDARFHAHRARCLLVINRQDLAWPAARQAMKCGPKDALTFDTVGVVLTRLGAHEEAVQLFETAVSQNPKDANFYYNLGASRQFSGEFEGAAKAYKRAIEIDPSLYKASSALVSLGRDYGDPALEAKLEQAFESGTPSAERDLHLGHALAKLCEDRKDYPAAMQWLKKAKALKSRELGHDPEQDRKVFAAAARVPKSVRSRGHDTDRPIFVVGMPRTGTTLVDRILGAHGDVEMAGELSNFSIQMKRLAGTPGGFVMDAPTLEQGWNLDFSALGKAYEDSTRNLVGEARRFTDKMPLNFMFAGHILAALPNARIVCLRRHPLDTCLSNFRQLFATSFSYYNYAYSLEHTARYYLEFDRLMRVWRERLPADSFMEIVYEDIIADQEGETRRLLSHCGLDWQDACLDFHQQDAAVATASSVQVRQPLYSSSVGRWKHYREALLPVIARLQEGGVLDADGQWLRPRAAAAQRT